MCTRGSWRERVVFVLLLAAVTALAQPGAIADPPGQLGTKARAAASEDALSASARISEAVLGYVTDANAAAVRPILGIPGAAVLGKSLELGAAVRGALVAPEQDFFLATEAGSGEVLLVRLEGGVPGVNRLADARAWPDQVVLSPSGRAAALYHRSASRIQIVSGLPEAPAVVADLDVSAASGPLQALALSDDAACMLAVAGDPETGQAIFLDRAGSPQPLPLSPGISSLSFFRDSQDAVAADGQRNLIYRLRPAQGVWEWSLLGGEAEGISGPVAVAVSGDNHKILVANARSRSVAVIDLKGGPPSAVPCECSPTGLHRLRGNAVFRLTEPSAEPMWMIDGDAAEPRLLFIPPDRGQDPEPTAP